MAHGRWFRFYDDVINDPKVQTLSGDAFKAWVNMLCLTSKSGDGSLPSVDEIAFVLRISGEQASDFVSDFVDRDLLEQDETGLYIHNWNGRQPLSAVSTPRVKAFRERKQKQGETKTETFHETTAKRPMQQAKRAAKRTETVQEENRKERGEEKRIEQNPYPPPTEQGAAREEAGGGGEAALMPEVDLVAPTADVAPARPSPPPEPEQDPIDPNDPWVILATDIVEAFADAGNPNSPDPFNEIPNWKAMEFRPEIVLATIKRILKTNKTVKSLRYFAEAIVRDHETNATNRARVQAAAPPPPSSEAVRRNWETRVKSFKLNRVWVPAYGLPPDMPGTQVPRDILAKFGFAEPQTHQSAEN